MDAPETVIASVMGTMLNSVARPFVKGKVLDVGCGRKPYKRMFPDCEWVGLDVRPVGEIAAAAESIPAPDDTYDTVVCTDLLSYVLSPIRVVREMSRVLKPGGHIIILARSTSPNDDEVMWKFGKKGLDFLIAACNLEHVGSQADGALIGAEWASLTNYEKYSLRIPPDVTGWIDLMNQRYPAVAMVVAKKPS